MRSIIFTIYYKGWTMIDPKIDDQGYCLPPEMSNILTATISETSQGDVILCHDNAFIYAAKVVKGGGNVTFQKFSLPLVSSISSIIKNYFMALFDSKRLIIFQVGYNQQGKIVLKFIFNKDRPISSYFIREVTDNMAELQIYFPDNQIIIYQFTVNGKIGIMNYALTAQNKIRLCQRQQLYGSKTMFSSHKKSIYYFTNFSNKFVSIFNLNKFENQMATQHNAFPIAYVSRLEQFYALLSNYVVVNVMGSAAQHRVYCEQGQAKIIQQLVDPKEVDRYRQKGQKGLKITPYFDLVLIQDIQRSIAYIFQIKIKGSALIGVQYGKMNWFWTGSKKLVGLSLNRNRFKIIDQIKINQRDEVQNPFFSALNPSNLRKDFKIKDNAKNYNEGKQKINPKNIFKESKESQTSSPNKFSLSQGSKNQIKNANEDEKQENKQKSVRQFPQSHFPPPYHRPFTQMPVGMLPPGMLPTDAVRQGFPPMPPLGFTNIYQGMVPPPSCFPNIPMMIPTTLPQKTVQPAEKFKPNKIIQKNKVSVSKTVNKSKEIQPMSKQQNQKANEASVEVKQPNEQVSKQEQKIQEQQKKQDELAQQQISQQCQKMANAILQKQEQPVSQAIKSEQKQQQQVEAEGADSNEQVEIKKQADVYPKDESSLSQSIVVPEKQNQQAALDEDLDNNIDQQVKQESLPKSLALAIGKSNLGGQYSHPLNLFNTSINRNNIFNSNPTNQYRSHQNLQQLRRYHSQQEYYNPLASVSPCLSPKKQQIYKQQQKKEDEQVDLVKAVKQLFSETTAQLIKVVQQLSNLQKSQPYLKEKIVDQMKKNIREALQKMILGQFTSRIQRYFYQIFRQTDQVQQQSIKFYKEANNHRANNIEVHLNNQEKIIKQVRQIQSNLRFSIAHLKDGNRANFQVFLRQWAQNAQQTKKIVQDLHATRSKIEIQEHERGKRYEQTKSKLDAIKILLSERINAQAEKKQRRLDRQKIKQVEKQEKVKKKRKVQKKVKKSSAI